MNRILYIQASPRGARSRSMAVADAFVASCKAATPGAVITKRDLFAADLPPFDGDRLAAKYAVMNGQEHDPAQAEAWKQVTDFIDEIKSHDVLVFAVPMWNFSIPYRLKHWLDLVIQPGQTFGMDDSGNYFGMVEGKKAFVAYARGGQYPPGTPGEAFNFQSPYFEAALGFMGVTDVVSVAAEGMLHGPEVSGPALEKAIKAARKAAAKF